MWKLRAGVDGCHPCEVTSGLNGSDPGKPYDRSVGERTTRLDLDGETDAAVARLTRARRDRPDWDRLSDVHGTNALQTWSGVPTSTQGETSDR